MKIIYPHEQQTLELTPAQTFCLVDVPDGGNTQGLKRRHKINDQSWTDYQTITTLCYDPAEGQNSLRLQYKNKYDQESVEYSINFTFHHLP